MSGSIFSSRDSSVFDRTVDCELLKVKKTSKSEIVDRYELKSCIDWVTVNQFKRVCLQFPDKLLPDSTSVSLYLKQTLEAECYILGDTSYGSCCVDEVTAEHIGADAVIHFGHACLSPTTKLPVLYIYMNENLDVNHLKTSVSSVAPDSNAIIFYDVKFLHLYTQLADTFKSQPKIQIARKKINTGSAITETEDDSMSNEDIEKNLTNLLNWEFHLQDNEQCTGIYIGEDDLPFQNLVLALPALHWHRFENTTLHPVRVDNNRFLMQRLHLVERVKDAHVIGVLVVTLGVKNYLAAVNYILELAKKKGKKCYTLSVGKPNVEKLANLPEIDIYVAVACPENTLSRQHKEFYKPIVSILEVVMALGDTKWSTKYNSDFSQILADSKNQTNSTEEESDMSLVSGKLRSMQVDAEPDGTSMDLAERQRWTVSEYGGANFLASRSWKGLDPALGQTPVTKAEQGRTGLARGYANEGQTPEKRQE